MYDEPLAVIAAGGTGGHMFPAQALAEELIRRGWRVKLSTDARGNRYSGGFPDEVEREVVSAATTARGGLLGKLTVPFKILAGSVTAIRSMRRDRPLVVIGFGGYPAVPAMLAARLLRIPRMVHEQNAVLGRVNRFFARRVNVVACSFWPTAVPAQTRTVHTGNPVRAAVLEFACADYIPPGNWEMRLLVIGGSQGASIFARVVPEAVALLPEQMRHLLVVQQQARSADLDAVRAAYANLGVKAEISTFFDDVPARMAHSQLVISRAGASSLADVTVVGRPSVLVPLAIATNDHQTANANGLVSAGGAFAIPENRLTAGVLSEHIAAILSDPDGAAAMAQAAAAQGRPKAAQELADLVESLAQKG